MIHLIDRSNRHLYGRELGQLHLQRARCFIDERGWPLRRTEAGEFDDYDDAAATYLVAFDAEKSVRAACRIRPTEHGGLIPDHFPHLVSDAERPLKVVGTYECTRYFCVPDLRGVAGMMTRSAIHTAMIEHVIDIGGNRLVGFVDLPLLTHLRRFSGLRIRPIGLPATYDDGAMTIAFEIGVTATDLEETRRRLDQTGRQLFVASAWMDGRADLHALASAYALLAAETTAAEMEETIRTVGGRASSLADQVVTGSAA